MALKNSGTPSRRNRIRRARTFTRAADATPGIKATPERGFHYFPSQESGEDEENIAHQYFYCATAVDEWPEFRRWMEKTGLKSPLECDQIERNAVDVFREFRDAIVIAIDTDNLSVMSQPRLLDRLAHAHGYLALHADPARVAGYRCMICPQIVDLPESVQPKVGDFMQSLWEGKWNEPGDQMPADVTRREARRISLSHRNDGLYNTRGRLDPVARAQQQIEPLFASEQIGQMFPTAEPHYKPVEETELLPILSGRQGSDFLSPMKRALTREATRHLFLRVGVKPKHASFGVRIIHDDAKQKDNPTAWKAIYRKRPELLLEARKLLCS